MRVAGRGTWLDPGWRDEVVGWATGRLAEAGRRVTGAVDQPHVRPWSTVLRIPTDAGPAWCKAVGPGVAHEARLLAFLAARDAPLVLAPLAIDVERGWILLPDGGPSMRQTRPDGTGDRDLDAWSEILAAYASMQRSLETDAGPLLATGLPDLRPTALPAVLDRLLDDPAIWDEARMAAEDRPAAAPTRARLRALRPWAAEASARLADSGIRPTLQHDDLHGGNVFVAADGPRIFDWGDASLAHPFMTLTATLNSIAHATGLGREGAELGRLRDAYLAAWADVHSGPELATIAGLAVDLGRISRAAAWARAQSGVPADELEDDGGAPAAWLGDLVERVDGRPAA